MSNQTQPWGVAVADRWEEEELPVMDGSCDACEPDEAPPASQVCLACGFAFCPAHAAAHAARTRHPLTPCARAEGGAAGAAGGGGAEGGGGTETEAGERRQENMVIFGARVEEEAGEMAGGEEEAGHATADGEEPEEGNMEAEGEEEAAAGGGEEAGHVTAAGGTGEEVRCEEVRCAGEEAEGSEEPQGAAASAGRRDTVTVERLRCQEHGQEGSLYCRPDEKVICVVCAVQGEHRDHEIITLHQAYLWQKGRERCDLLGYTQQMGQNIKTKLTNPGMTPAELVVYVNGQFDWLKRCVRAEERRHLHLVDLKEACLTAAAAEQIAEIYVDTERLQDQMDSITQELELLDRAGEYPRLLEFHEPPPPAAVRDAEARARIPEPRREPRDFDRNGPGPMDHAP